MEQTVPKRSDMEERPPRYSTPLKIATALHNRYDSLCEKFNVLTSKAEALISDRRTAPINDQLKDILKLIAAADVDTDDLNAMAEDLDRGKALLSFVLTSSL